MGDDATNSDRIVNLLEELVIWTKTGLYGSVSKLITDQFGKARPEQRLAYELCEDQTYEEIVEICRASVDDARISTSSVSNWMRTWENLGLITRDGRSVRKHFSLDDFGISVPNPADVGDDE